MYAFYYAGLYPIAFMQAFPSTRPTCGRKAAPYGFPCSGDGNTAAHTQAARGNACFLLSRGYDVEEKTLDFLNLELSHLYRVAIEPGYKDLTPIETVFSMMYFYIYGIRPSSVMFQFPPTGEYQLSESAENYGVSPNDLYDEALMSVIRSHLDNMKKRQEAVKNE